MIERLESKLYFHALDTDDLIYEYYLKRLEVQKETKEASEGVLTVKLLFINNILKMDILNAHRLRSMDYNGEDGSINRVIYTKPVFLRYKINFQVLAIHM